MNPGRFLALMLLSILMLLFGATLSFAQDYSPKHSKEEKQVRVTGCIELERLAPNAGCQNITLTFLDLEEPLQYTIQIMQGGKVHFYLKPGHYSAIVRGAKWLARRVAIDATQPDTTFQALLLGGDASGDNRVDWDDLDILADAFYSLPGDVNWDERADVDCDGDVDDADADIIFLNLNRYGD